MTNYQVGGLAAIAGVPLRSDDDDDESITRELVESAKPDPVRDLRKRMKINRDQAMTSLRSAREAILSQRADPAAKWFALAQGMLAPTRTGGFGESLGATAGLLGIERKERRATEIAQAEKLRAIEASEHQVEERSIAQEMSLRSAAGLGPSSAMRMFAEMTKDLSPEDLRKAQRIELGLDPRKVGTGKITTATVEGLTELVATSEALIKERGKFAEMTGASRAKTIDKGFETITAIDTNMRNLDRAISALQEGASTGFVEQFIPSIREASIKLDQIQGELALDVVGATTFGALSKGELDLAKEIALPTALEPPELLEYLVARKAAQEKLRGYYMEQINFLDQGGTVAGFIRKKERELGNQQPASLGSRENPVPASSVKPPSGTWVELPNGRVVQVK